MRFLKFETHNKIEKRPRRSSGTHNGEMAERSNAAVLKTVDAQASGGSNPFLSANEGHPTGAFFGGGEKG